MGHHRLLIHPEFGSSVLLSTLVLNRPVSQYGSPVKEDPCDGCKLCVAACPTGAIAPNGRFSLINCVTHNYRYRLGGFSDWVETVVKSRDPLEYRRTVKDSETVSMWQALACGTNYTCCNCLAVCPAGQEGQVDAKSGDTASDRKDLVRKLRDRVGPVYVLKGSDAEAYAAKNFPPDLVRRVGGGTRPATVGGFLRALPLVFQPGRAEGLDAVYHFDFTGTEPCHATVVIKDRTLAISAGLQGKPSLSVRADGPTWLAFLRGERGLLWALITRKIRIEGSPVLLKAFAACFPG
jgi:NAD-dependent dihydropyrimidine dehydrogenase PreA subunit